MTPSQRYNIEQLESTIRRAKYDLKVVKKSFGIEKPEFTSRDRAIAAYKVSQDVNRITQFIRWFPYDHLPKYLRTKFVVKFFKAIANFIYRKEFNKQLKNLH